MEVRLIDESTLQRELFCQIQQNAIESGSAHYDGYKNWCLSGLEVEKAINDIFSETSPFASTIDPETLPIVQQLRKQLADVDAVKHANCEEECPCDADGKYLDAKFCPHCGCKMDLEE